MIGRQMKTLTNGSASAAILAAGFGCFLLGIFACIADYWKGVAKLLIFYAPTGPLSGVTTCSIILWLITWLILSKRWRAKTIAIEKINVLAFCFLGAGVLLTFPPFMDFLQGK